MTLQDRIQDITAMTIRMKVYKMFVIIEHKHLFCGVMNFNNLIHTLSIYRVLCKHTGKQDLIYTCVQAVK